MQKRHRRAGSAGDSIRALKSSPAGASQGHSECDIFVSEMDIFDLTDGIIKRRSR
jgi:hypothetical protein